MSTSDPTGGGSHHPIDVGDKLGQYKLVELIAIGGMGIVYRAYEKSLDRYVAVKVLSHELAKDAEVAHRFLDEARASATLNHPNVVHVYSAGEQAGTFYFVMELVVGEHMEALLARQHELPVREAVGYIRQIALGLQHAHEHGIIHGDVKPANFLLSETGVVKVTDFGLARRLKAKSGRPSTESVFGTPGYVSPEVIEGQMPDHRSDIYSLGATLFHMLAGKPPFVGETPEETMRQHVEKPVPPLSHINSAVPQALTQIVTRMLSKQPAGRYQSYNDLLHALDRFLAAKQLPGKQGKSLPGPSAAGPRGLAKEPGARPAGLSGGGGATPPPSPEEPKHPKRETIISFVFTLISVIACIIILILVYRAKKAGQKLIEPLIVITNSAPAQPPVQVVDVEAVARKEFEALKPQADAAADGGQPGRAYSIYSHWDAAKYGSTTAGVAVAAERAKFLTTAKQQWEAGSQQVQTLREVNNLPAAVAACDRLARICEGVPELSAQVLALRRDLDKEKEEAEAKLAAEKAATERARQAKLDQWKTLFDGYVLGFQWEKGQQEAQRFLAGAGDDAVFKEALGWYQLEMDKLVALRKGATERLTDTPSAQIKVTTKQGEIPVQVVEIAPDRVKLRRNLDAAGYAEMSLAWNELTPASICRVFMACLDQNKPDEVQGYAVLLAHQALAKQARVDDARQTLQAIRQRDPSKAEFVDRYLSQFVELDRSAQQADAARKVEAEAQALWTQMQMDAVQSQWPKVREQLTRLTTDYGTTAFVKSHGTDLQQMAKAVAQNTGPKGYSPLDIASACNVDFIGQPGSRRAERGFFRGSQFATAEMAKDKGSGVPGLPDDGRVAVPDSDPPGIFQLRVNEHKDAIALTWAEGQYPMEVTVSLPAAQQRKYSSVALLFANSIGRGTFRVALNYDNRDQATAKLKSTSWTEVHLGKDRDETPAVTGSDTVNGREAHLFASAVQSDPTRKLVSITLTWLSANTENPDHCIAIFAISGMAEK